MSRKYKRKKSPSKKNRYLITLLLIGASFLLGLWTERYDVSFSWIKGYGEELTSYIQSLRPPFKEKTTSDYLAEYHFFDVGQGSSALLEAHDGTTILIDTGRYDQSETEIVNYLNEVIGVGGEIDLLIFTHNDADHIGNGEFVLEYFQVDEVWMNGMDHTSQVYSRVLDTLLASDVTYAEPKNGYETEIGVFTVEVLHPVEHESQSNQNDESIVTRITIGETSLMHTGDVSSPVEARIAEEKAGQLQSDIMVVGHHGSRTSTSEAWIKAVDPRVAVYQAGKTNHYGHPHSEIWDRFSEHRSKLLGTDEYGTIRITITHDNQLEVFTEEEN